MDDDHPYVAWLKHRYTVGEIEVEELEERLELGLRAEAGERVMFPSEFWNHRRSTWGTDAPGGVWAYQEVLKEVYTSPSRVMR